MSEFRDKPIKKNKSTFLSSYRYFMKGIYELDKSMQQQRVPELDKAGVSSIYRRVNKALQQINNQSNIPNFQTNGNYSFIQYFLTQQPLRPQISNCLLYYYQPSYQPFQYFSNQQSSQPSSYSQLNLIQSCYNICQGSSYEDRSQNLISTKLTETSQIDSFSQNKSLTKKSISLPKSELLTDSKGLNKEIKLSFRIEWKNQNRNIVPNLVNQMISYLLKKSKSQKLVKRLFEFLPHQSNWTERKFYLYMKKIKQSVTHYVNENVILRFMEIHEPKCQLYAYDEQLFYMRICRIAILRFLENDAILISLTSNRMSQAKREIHLIAREALLRKFKEICRECRY